VRVGFLALFAGIAVMVALLDIGAGPEIVTWPMLLAGLGIGALASQLGAATLSSGPDERTGEAGGRRARGDRPRRGSSYLGAHDVVLRQPRGQSGRPRSGRVPGGGRVDQ